MCSRSRRRRSPRRTTSNGVFLNLEKYRALFVDEASDHLHEMARALGELASASSEATPAEAIDTLFRLAHSIKGMAASLDYEAVSSLAHQLEDFMEPLRASGTAPDLAGQTLIAEVIGVLEEMVSVVEISGEPPAPRPDLGARLVSPSALGVGAGSARVARGPSEEKKLAPAAPQPSRSVRVRTEVVDRFLAAVSVLEQRQARLEILHRRAPYSEYHGEFTDELDQLARTVRELRRRALEIRITPVRRVLERLPRIALDLGRELGKRVRVELSGDEVEVDRAVLDHLDEALLHLVRNAVDHGLESESERVALGKDPIGCLRLRATRVAGRFHLRIEEDGRGIDVEKVRRRSIERGLVLEMVAEDLSPERICEFIFEPGLSTADSVSNISGRGVGLDAVKRQVESLGGRISVESTPGRGTAFELDLPSMVALQRVLVLRLGEHRVALPISAVEAVLAADEAEVQRAEVDAFFMLKDEPLPLVDLGPRLGLAPAKTEGGNVVVVDVRGFKFGALVDRVTQDLEVFVRKTPPPLDALAALGGVAILPDGGPVFLLEVGNLVEAAT